MGGERGGEVGREMSGKGRGLSAEKTGLISISVDTKNVLEKYLLNFFLID